MSCVTTDLLTEGVDFQLDHDDPRRIGRKALAVNLSDLAAMAARPLAAVVSSPCPAPVAADTSPLDLVIALYEGLLPLAAEFDLAIAGGDTNTHDGPLVICVTVFGQVTSRGPLRARRRPAGRQAARHRFAGRQHRRTPLRFHATRARGPAAPPSATNLHAGMDISDGLALDLSRLAAESGCGAVIQTADVPISDAARQLPDPLQHALGDGEDFELLLAAPPDAAADDPAGCPLDCPITCIGELIAAQGLWQQSAGGKRSPLEPHGWQH